MKNIKLTAFSVTLITLLIRFMSFFRDMILAEKFGTGSENDIFIASQSIISVFAGFMMQSLISAYLPYASDYYFGSNNDKGYFFGSIYLQAFIWGLFQIILCFAGMKGIIKLVTPGFDVDSQQLLQNMIMLQFPILITQMINGISDTNLQVIGKYNFVQFASAVPYITVLIYLFVFRGTTLNGLAVSITLGNIIMLIIKFPYINRYIQPKLGRKIWFSEMKKMYANVGLQMITTAVRQLNTIVDQSVASLLGEGNMTLLSYAMKIPVTESSLISTALSTIIFSEMAKNISNKEADKNRLLFSEALSITVTLIIPLMLFTIIFRVEIITILFQRGSFTADDSLETARLMAYYSIEMIGLSFQDVIVRTMFAYKIRKYSVITSIILVSTNIFLNFATYKTLGNTGIALASSISVLIIIPLLLYWCNKKILRIDWRSFGNVTFKSCVSTLAAVISSLIINGILYKFNCPLLLLFISSSIVFFAVYLSASIIAGNKTVIDVVSTLRNKLK